VVTVIIPSGEDYSNSGLHSNIDGDKLRRVVDTGGNVAPAVA